jgi:hypothetical protein
VDKIATPNNINAATNPIFFIAPGYSCGEHSTPFRRTESRMSVAWYWCTLTLEKENR